MERTNSSVHPLPLWKRIRQAARENGPRGIIQRVVKRVTAHGLRIEIGVVITFPLDDGKPLLQARVPAEVGQVERSDEAGVRELVSMYGTRFSEAEALERLQSEYCFISRVDGKIAGYQWVRPSGIVKEYGQVIYHLKPEEVYFHDAYVSPDQRGKGICPALIDAAGRAVARIGGKTCAVTLVRRENAASLNMFRKLEACQVGRIVFLTLLGTRRKFHFKFPSRKI